jgi:hypothetical protein
MTTSVNQYQPMENGNGLDLQLIIRGSPDTSGWAHAQNQTLTRSTCRCFFFTPGRRQDLEEFGGFVLKNSAGNFVYF